MLVGDYPVKFVVTINCRIRTVAVTFQVAGFVVIKYFSFNRVGLAIVIDAGKPAVFIIFVFCCVSVSVDLKRQVAVVVIFILCCVAKRILDGNQPSCSVVGIGCCLPFGVGDCFDIACGVVGVGCLKQRCPVVANGFCQPVLRMVFVFGCVAVGIGYKNKVACPVVFIFCVLG